MEEFRGLVSIIEMTDGDFCFGEIPKAGRIPVCGKGMLGLQMFPDDGHRIVTAKFLPKSRMVEGVYYSKTVSVWYVDVIDGWGYDDDGVAYFGDQYLDVIFDLEGDVIIDDRDELDAAYNCGELSKEKYSRAIVEGDAVIADLCFDVEIKQVGLFGYLKLREWNRIHEFDKIKAK